MLKEQTIRVKVNSNQYNSLKEKGYIFDRTGDIIFIKIDDLSPTSKQIIECYCDVCQKLCTIPYATYYLNIRKHDLYFCDKKCMYKILPTHKHTQETKDKISSGLKETFSDQNKFETFQNKKKLTMIERYGAEHATQVPEFREKIYTLENIDKAKISREKIMIETYGVSSQFHRPEIRKKCLETIQEKYGVDNIMELDEYKNKVQETTLDKYGVRHPLQDKDIMEKAKEKKLLSYVDINRKEYFNKRGFDIIDYLGDSYYVLQKNMDPPFTIHQNLFYYRDLYGIEIDINKNPIGSCSSGQEDSFYEFILTIVPNTEIIRNDRNQLKGKEIDIFIPSMNIGIEYCGLYWHSDKYVDKYYHYNKYKECLKLGIKLIFIWSDDWIYRKDIVKSIVLNKLKIINKKLHARKGIIKLVSNSDARIFLQNNHIQGECNCDIAYGLYFNDEIFSLITFGTRYINGLKQFELLRFCNKINYILSGSASKLFQYFLKNNDNGEIVSYSENALFDGGLYEKLGFKYDRDTKINYYWTKGDKKFHRYTFNKKRLVEMGNDPNMSEKDIMYNLGYYKVFSVGQKKWIFNP